MNIRNKIMIATFIPLLMLVTISCAPYLYSLHVPVTGYVVAKNIAEDNDTETGIERFNLELAESGKPVTLEDTYRAAYGKELKDTPDNGDTGQAFAGMKDATRYFRNILMAEGIADAENYVLTRYEDRARQGFELIAVVYRPERVIKVKDQNNPELRKVLAPNTPAYYRPYQTDGYGRPLDEVREWAAVPKDCLEKQGQQAVLLTAAANRVISREAPRDFWLAVQDWRNGDTGSVIIAQDYLACRSLGEMRG